MNAATLSTYDIPSGDAGLAEKAKLMVRFAQEDVATPELRRHLAAALRGVPERDAKAEVGAIFNYIRRNVRFVQDPLPYTELIQRPLVTLDLGLGDCDDFATLGAAFLGAAGYDADLEFISTRPSGSWSHVYNRAYFPARTRGSSIPFDSSATRPARPLGWEVPRGRVTRRLSIPVFGLSGSRSELMGATPQFRTARQMHTARNNGTPQGVLWRQTQDGLDRVRLNNSGAPPSRRDYTHPPAGTPTPPNYSMYEPQPSYYMGHSGGRGRQIRFQNVSTFNGTRDPKGMPDYFAAQGEEVQNIMRVRSGLPFEGEPSLRPAWSGVGDLGKWKLPKIKPPKLPPIVTKIAGKIGIPPPEKIAAKIHAAAKHLEAEAVKVGHNPAKAFSQGYHYYARKAADDIHKALAKLPKFKMSPLKKALYEFSLLPPPINAIAAAKVIKAHRDEVLKELPPYVRDFIVKLEHSLDGLLSGKQTGLSAEDEATFAAGIGMSWSEIKSKIARAWDQLSKGKKATIIAILVLALILGIALIVVSFGAGAPAAPAASTGVAGAGTAAAAPGFFSGIGGWGTMSGLVGALLGMFKSHKGVPDDVAANTPTEGQVPDPPPPASDGTDLVPGGGGALIPLAAAGAAAAYFLL